MLAACNSSLVLWMLWSCIETCFWWILKQVINLCLSQNILICFSCYYHKSYLRSQLLFIFRDGHHHSEDSRRTLKGTMRVGILSNMQILKNDRNFRMVLLLSTKPTLSLLERIYRSFQRHIRVGYYVLQNCCLCLFSLLKFHFKLLEFDVWNVLDANNCLG